MSTPCTFPAAAATSCALCATRSLCIVSRLPADELPALEPAIRKRTVGRGHELATQGQTADAVTVLKMGTVTGYRRGIDGNLRPVGMQGRGSAFGLFAVMGQPTPVTSRTAGAARICEVPVARLREIVERRPELAGCIAAAAAENCSRLALWSEAMRLRGVANQLAYTLVLLSQAQGLTVIELPTHSALAELLGTTRETVVRSLGVLEQEGGVRRGERRSCEIFRKELLSRIRGSSPVQVAAAA